MAWSRHEGDVLIAPCKSLWFSFRFALGTVKRLVHGLYDHDGILRFIGLDREACVAYAELFDLSLTRCSLMDLPMPLPLAVRSRQRMIPGAGNS